MNRLQASITAATIGQLLFAAVPLPPPLPTAIHPTAAPKAIPSFQTATMTWNLVPEPKITTYRVYHTTLPPPRPAWPGTHQTDYTVKFPNGATAGYPAPPASIKYDLGITNRFVHGNLDRTKTNLWALTYLVDSRRIVGGGVEGKIQESDFSNWLQLPPASAPPATTQPPINLRSPKPSSK